LLLELGDPGEAIAVGEELLEDDPCRETCHQLMMRAYAAMDQRHLVVQQFDRCQKVLRCELALDPMESTVDIYQSLIRDH
jgi:DNA-binding SARP family transcriptional activator